MDVDIGRTYCSNRLMRRLLVSDMPSEAKIVIRHRNSRPRLTNQAAIFA